MSGVLQNPKGVGTVPASHGYNSEQSKTIMHKLTLMQSTATESEVFMPSMLYIRIYTWPCYLERPQ